MAETDAETMGEIRGFGRFFGPGGRTAGESPAATAHGPRRLP